MWLPLQYEISYKSTLPLKPDIYPFKNLDYFFQTKNFAWDFAHSKCNYDNLLGRKLTLQNTRLCTCLTLVCKSIHFSFANSHLLWLIWEKYSRYNSSTKWGIYEQRKILDEVTL